MSIVLSYRALRDEPLSADEAAAIDIVIARYQSDFEYREAADAFTVNPSDPNASEVIFSGTVCPLGKLLSGSSTERICRRKNDWMCCLTDIRRILEDADWTVSQGDTALDWDEDDGWMLPET